MTRYSNGYVPASALVQFDSGGGKHMGTVTTRARWYQGRENIRRRTGTTLHITEGWNVYRPYAQQVIGRQQACAQGNCLAAASPGYSSHGGTWANDKYTGGKWVDSFAIDVGDYYRVSWQIFVEEMSKVGFTVGAITTAIAGREEPWHIIDLNPYGGFTAGGVTEPFMDEKSIATEIWRNTKVARSGDYISTIQELADAKTQATAANLKLGTLPDDTWAVTINRGSTKVPALQELADTKTNTILLRSQSDAILDAIGKIQVPGGSGGITDTQIKTIIDGVVAGVLAGIPKPTPAPVPPTAAENATAVREKFRTDPLK